MDHIANHLKKLLGNRVKTNRALAPLSTFRIGGKAEYFFEARTAKELVHAYRAARELKLPFHTVAGGSNAVFTDGLLRGLLTQVKSKKLKVKDKKITADAGVDLQRLIRTSIHHGLKGLETLSGIPGSVGGAIVGNAGAYGHEISETLRKVEIFDGEKRIWLSKSDCKFSYRDSIFKHKPWLLLNAELSFSKGSKKKLKKISRDIIAIRLKKYKPSLRCPGSFFKNILVKELSQKTLKIIDRSKIIKGKLPTGWLLEQVGAKGMRKGGIEIAAWHANLFFNHGKAQAKDVKSFAKLLKEKVRRKFGIWLEEEIKYIE